MTKTRASQALIDWYWEHGVNRDKGDAPVSGKWLRKIYQANDQANALEANTGRPKLAVWGQSQTGKSTLIANVTENRNTWQTAFTWGGKSYLFTGPIAAEIDELKAEGRTIPPSINPYHGESDGSAVVSRFFLPETEVDASHPVRIRMLGLQDIIRMLAIGYISECDTFRHLGEEQPIVIDTADVEQQLLDLGDISDSRDREATEFLLALVAVVDSIIPRRDIRYSVLNKNNRWITRLSDMVVQSAALNSNLNEAVSFANWLLWDNFKPLNALLSEIMAFRKHLNTQFGGRSIFCDIELARLLLDMQTYGVLKDGNRAHEISLNEFTYTIEEDQVFIRRGPGGTQLFDGDLQAQTVAFGLFQAICWQLDLPVHPETLRDIRPDSFEILTEIDILDIPGLTNVSEGAEDSRISENEPYDSRNMFKAVVKKGKTFSLIDRFAREFWIDGLLLVARAGNQTKDAKELAEGALGVLTAIDPEFKTDNRDSLPIPVSLNLSFISSIVNEVYESRQFHHDTQMERLAPFGIVGKPAFSRFYATNYAWWIKHQIAFDSSKIDRVVEIMNSSGWVDTHFPTPEERNSLKLAMNPNDGGAMHLLQQQAKLVSKEKRHNRINRVSERISSNLRHLVAEVGPNMDNDNDVARMALVSLRERLQASLAKLQVEENPDTQLEIAQNIASNLREAFSCEVNDFLGMEDRRYPDKTLVANILNDATRYWATSDRRIRAFEGLDVQASELPTLMRVLSDTALHSKEEMEDWLSKRNWFSSQWNSPDQVNARRNALRYVAIKLTNELKRYFPTSKKSSDQRELAESFIQQTQNNRLHPYEVFVFYPYLEWLDELPDKLGASERTKQTGDDELIELASRFGFAQFEITRDDAEVEEVTTDE